MKLYNLSVVKTLINEYIQLGGSTTTIQEGVLGYGITLLEANGKKTCVIKEVYLSEWSSAHSIRFYNKKPKKYGTLN